MTRARSRGRLALLGSLAAALSLCGSGCFSSWLYESALGPVGDRHSTIFEGASVEEDADGAPVVRIALLENERRHEIVCRPGRPSMESALAPASATRSARPFILRPPGARPVCQGDLVSLTRPDGAVEQVFMGVTGTARADIVVVELEGEAPFARLHRAPPGGRPPAMRMQRVDPGPLILHSPLALEEPRLAHPGSDVATATLWVLGAPVMLALDVVTAPVQLIALVIVLNTAPRGL